MQDSDYFMKGCNAGSGPDPLFDKAAASGAGAQGLDPLKPSPEPQSGQGRARTAARLALVRDMGEARFLELAARVEAACQQARMRSLCMRLSVTHSEFST